MPRSTIRLAVPALIAGAIPLASAVVIGAASGDLSGSLDGGVWRSAILAAGPFVLVAVLAARAEWAQPGFALAAAVGVALTAVGWGVATAGALQAMQTGSPLSLAIAAVLFRMLPVAVLSVMITVLAVRSLFGVAPTR